MTQPILTIQNLHAGVEGREILKGIDLTINVGEIHALMGPNGSGKSTLAAILAGRPGYAVAGGRVDYCGQDLLALAPEDRAHEGLFLAFQYPVEIPGVNSTYFLKSAYNELQKYRGQPELDAADFLVFVKEKVKLLDLDDDLLKRAVNEGFSGGEKKRNEIFQMAVLEPKLAILDETDSGLDIDALKIVAQGVNKLKRPDNAQLLITHYQRLLNYIVPDFVHVLHDGRIVRSGGKELALELEERGYDWLTRDDHDCRASNSIGNPIGSGLDSKGTGVVDVGPQEGAGGFFEKWFAHRQGRGLAFYQSRASRRTLVRADFAPDARPSIERGARAIAFQRAGGNPARFCERPFFSGAFLNRRARGQREDHGAGGRPGERACLD